MILLLLTVSQVIRALHACTVLDDCATPDEDCVGALVMVSAEDKEDKIFNYDSSSLDCEAETLDEPFRFSEAKVEGCGYFTLHMGRRGKGQQVPIREAFRNISSVRRLFQCPDRGVACYLNLGPY